MAFIQSPFASLATESDEVFRLRVQVAGLEAQLRLMAQTAEVMVADQKKRYAALVETLQKERLLYTNLDYKHGVLARQHKILADKCVKDSIAHEATAKKYGKAKIEIGLLRAKCDEKEKAHSSLDMSFNTLMDTMKRHYDDCSICLSPVVSALSCGHVFHGSCIGEWTKKNSSCPNCRSGI
jgi:hypothetical protein